jgi:hypothetical protein
MTSLLPVLLALASAAPPAPTGRSIAIYPLQPLGTEQQVVDGLEAMLYAEVAKLPAIRLLTRAETTLTIQQTAGAAAPCSDDACLAKVGVACNVDKLVFGTVASLGQSYVLDLKLIDVRSGMLERLQSTSLSGDQTVLIEGIRAAATQLIAPDLYVGAIELKLGKPGAEVFLDGVSVGATPLAVLDRITPGKHALKIVLQGYRDFDRFVEVRLGRTTVVNVALSGTAIDATIEAKEAAPQPAPVLVVTEPAKQPSLFDSPLFLTGVFTSGAGLALAAIGGGAIIYRYTAFHFDGTTDGGVAKDGSKDHVIVVIDQPKYDNSKLNADVLQYGGWFGVGIGAAVLLTGGALMIWDVLDRPTEVSESMPQ